MIQDVLALGTVGLAAMYVVARLVVLPAVKKNAPDVPTRRLVRKNRRGGDCCP